MIDRRRPDPTHPPSDPHPGSALGRLAGFDVDDRPVRAPLIGALLLGLLLVAIGLYLWRRPPTAQAASAGETEPPLVSSAPTMAFSATIPWVAPDAGAAPVALSEVHVLGCHDRGPTKTPPEQCDHLAPIEQALSRAIEKAATCAPPSGSTIQYVADVSFLRSKVRVSLPRTGRSVRDLRVVGACATAVRDAVQGVPLDSVDHRHAQYRIAVTATYRDKG